MPGGSWTRLAAEVADDLRDLALGESAVACLGPLQHRLGQLLVGGDLVSGEPVLDVGEAAHGTDLDLLRHAHLARRHAAVDAVGEPAVALPLRLDDGGGMHAGGGAERVLAGDGIVHRQRVSGDARRQLDEAHQCRHVARTVEGMVEQLQVDEELVAGRVAHALADARRAAVQARRSRGARRQRVGQGEAAVVVAVPVEPDVGTGHLARELHQRGRALGGGVPDRVAETEAARARLDGALEEAPQIVRLAAGRVLGHVGDGEPFLHREGDGFDRLLLDETEVPLLGVLPDGRAADEGVDLERHAGLLLHLGGGRDVGDHGAAGDVEADGQFCVALLFGEPLHRGALVRARAGEADVELVDAQRVEQVEDLDLRLDGRVDGAGALDAVAQRLVEHDRLGQPPRTARPVPVVKQVLHVRMIPRYADSTSSAIPWPPPMHAEPTPRFAPRRFSSYRRCDVMRAPDAASGWPTAMAPPSTLVRSRGRPSSFSTARYCGANASFTSKRSKSFREASCRSNARRTAGAGPMPMIDGSQPEMPHPSSLPMGFKPFRSAKARVARMSAPAPSQMPLAAPAWMTPSFLNTLGSLARPSTVVSGRLCSSRANCTVAPFFAGSSMGAISSESRPASCAAAKRFCERTLYSSTSRCAMLYLAARFSAVMAMGRPV